MKMSEKVSSWMKGHGMGFVVDEWRSNRNEYLRKSLTKRNIVILVLVSVLIPFGWVAALLWITCRQDVDMGNYYDKSYGEFMERERKRKEAERDIHPVSNK